MISRLRGHLYDRLNGVQWHCLSSGNRWWPCSLTKARLGRTQKQEQVPNLWWVSPAKVYAWRSLSHPCSYTISLGCGSLSWMIVSWPRSCFLTQWCWQRWESFGYSCSMTTLWLLAKAFNCALAFSEHVWSLSFAGNCLCTIPAMLLQTRPHCRHRNSGP